MRTTARISFAVVTGLLLLLTLIPVAPVTQASAPIGPLDLSGELHGAPYRIRVPANWNGTLLVFTHGYRDKADHPGEIDLIKQLSIFPAVVARAADARGPHVICEYLEATAGAVNSWYHAGNPTRNPELAVLVADPALRRARLVLARAVRIVLRNGLEILGLTAPDRMEKEEEAA